MEPVQLELLKHHPALRQADPDALLRHNFWGQTGCLKRSALTGATALSFNTTGQQYKNTYESADSTVMYSVSSDVRANEEMRVLQGHIAYLVLVRGPAGPHHWAPVMVGPIDRQRGRVPLMLLAHTGRALFQ